jgi:hypothetical protein
MSGLPPKADIKRGRSHVRFVPKPDSCTAANTCAICTLFDHLVGAAEQRERNGDTERLSGLERFDYQLGFRCLLHRQVDRFLALENAASMMARGL